MQEELLDWSQSKIFLVSYCYCFENFYPLSHTSYTCFIIMRVSKSDGDSKKTNMKWDTIKQ